MKTIVIAAGATAMLLSLGAVDAAAGPRKAHRTSGAAVASPQQPIPYAMLDQYLRASPRERARRDWWSGAGVASTGTTTDTTAATSAASPMAGDRSGGAAGQVNTPTDAGASTGAANPGAPGATSPSSTSSSATTPR